MDVRRGLFRSDNEKRMIEDPFLSAMQVFRPALCDAYTERLAWRKEMGLRSSVFHYPERCCRVKLAGKPGLLHGVSPDHVGRLRPGVPAGEPLISKLRTCGNASTSCEL